MAFSIEQSDGVTAVSESLKRETYQSLPLKRDITRDPEFSRVRRPQATRASRAARAAVPAGSVRQADHPLSNFRPVKRVEAVVDIFERMRQKVRAKLIFVGEGPELNKAMRMVHERILACDVEALGEQEQVVPLLSVSDLFLLPSCAGKLRPGRARGHGVRRAGGGVARRRVAGSGRDGVSGFLLPPEDLQGMAEAAIQLLTDPALHARFSKAGLRPRPASTSAPSASSRSTKRIIRKSSDDQ